MSEKKESSGGLQLSKRQVSMVSAVIFLLMAAIFVGGYFLGAYQAIESFTFKAEQDSFADQVYASLSALYDQEDGFSKNETSNSDEESTFDIPVKENKKSAIRKEVARVELPMQEMPMLNPEMTTPDNQADTKESMQQGDIKKLEESDIGGGDEKTEDSIDSLELVKTTDIPGKRYYAQLIGYGLEKSARDFAQKLTKKGFDVEVTTRTSRSSAGVVRTWYQVVTAAHENRDLLQKQVDKIVSLEKLKGVQISIC